MDSSELAAAAVTSLLAALAGASATAVVDRGGTALAALVRGGLERSQRGQAALATLEADPGDTGARTEAEEALAEEITTDPDLRSRLTMLLDTSIRSYRDSVVITGSRVSRSPISLGPLTINNTAGGRALAGVAIVLAVAVLALAVYGTRQLVVTDDGASRSAPPAQTPTSGGPDQSPQGTGGKQDGHMLTDAEAELAMPRPEDVPKNWTLFSRSEARYQPDGCSAKTVLYEVDGGVEGKQYKLARFLVNTCPSEAAASAALPLLPILKEQPGPFDRPDGTPTDLGLPKLGDESTARAYDKDSSRTIVIAIRQGNAIVQLTYEFLSDSETDQNEALTRARMAHDRLKSVQAGTLRP
ncbi:hypothetical protein [Streptomyces sp. NPDC056883]|uniref:hypothetical protein n=1 Tax=Streptomyces sp. NPDC056883 TaxID=3345959 RepID=UPI0036A0F205